MDDKLKNLINKIRALMERTTANGCTEAEAMTAARLAQKLMDQAGITPDELAAGQTRASDTHWTRTTHDHPISVLGRAVRAFSGALVYCNTFSSVEEQRDLFGTVSRTQKQFRWLRIVGLEHEMQIAGYVLDICYNAMETAAVKGLRDENDERQRAGEPLILGGQRVQWIYDFQLGMARRMSETLLEMAPKADTSRQLSGATGRSLVEVRTDLIERWMQDHGVRLQSSAARSARSASGYEAGKRAGAGVNFSAGVASASQGGIRQIGGR